MGDLPEVIDEDLRLYPENVIVGMIGRLVAELEMRGQAVPFPTDGSIRNIDFEEDGLGSIYPLIPIKGYVLWVQAGGDAT